MVRFLGIEKNFIILHDGRIILVCIVCRHSRQYILVILKSTRMREFACIFHTFTRPYAGPQAPLPIPTTQISRHPCNPRNLATPLTESVIYRLMCNIYMDTEYEWAYQFLRKNKLSSCNNHCVVFHFFSGCIRLPASSNVMLSVA